MNIIEVFPIYDELEFLNIRSRTRAEVPYNYEFMPAILECSHQGQNINFDIEEIYKTTSLDHSVNFLRQSRYDAELAFESCSDVFAEKGFLENWAYELGQRKVIYGQLLQKFFGSQFPDILILSDADEVLFSSDFENIIKTKEQMYRCAMEWFIADPIFRYSNRWPGSLVLVGRSEIMRFLSDELSPIHYHLCRSLDFCKINAGKHLTYFGSRKNFKEKCKRIAEAKAKRVRLASKVGDLLLMCGLDPMLRFGLEVNKVSPDPQLSYLCRPEWKKLF